MNRFNLPIHSRLRSCLARAFSARSVNGWKRLQHCLNRRSLQAAIRIRRQPGAALPRIDDRWAPGFGVRLFRTSARAEARGSPGSRIPSDPNRSMGLIPLTLLLTVATGLATFHPVHAQPSGDGAARQDAGGSGQDDKPATQVAPRDPEKRPTPVTTGQTDGATPTRTTEDASPGGPSREAMFADFVPTSANMFITIRNLRTLDTALRRARAWPLVSSWSREGEEDDGRAPDIRTALAVLLGPATTINLNEFMESEVAIVAADWADLSHLLWLVRVQDATVIDRWFPPARRMAKHSYASAHAFRMDNGLVVTVRGNVFAMGRRWGGDRVLVDTMRLLQGMGGESLGSDPEYRSLASGLPGPTLCAATFRLDDGDATSGGTRNVRTARGPASMGSLGSLLPVGRRLVIGMTETRGGLEVFARGIGAFSKGAAQVGAATVTQLLSLPSTTILATASTISGAGGAPISSLARTASTWGRYARIFDALHRAGPRGSTALPAIGPGWILAWDQDLEGSGAAPQLAILVQCADAGRLAEDTRVVISDFARVLFPSASNATDVPALDIRERAHLGVSYFSVPLAPVLGGSTHPVMKLLRDAEISWGAADDWLVVTLGREHLERILDARAGLALPLRGLKEAPRLGSHATDYRFAALLQPSSAADVVERWRRRIVSGGSTPAATGGSRGPALPAGGGAGPASSNAFANEDSTGGASRADAGPTMDLGLTWASEPSGGSATVRSIHEDSPLKGVLYSGDVILGVDGQLLAMDAPETDLRSRLFAGGVPAGKSLRIRRADTMLEVVIPTAPKPVPPPALALTGDEPNDDVEELPALDALEDLLFTARTVSVATLAIEGGAPTRYSARMTLRFAAPPAGGKRAEGK